MGRKILIYLTSQWHDDVSFKFCSHHNTQLPSPAAPHSLTLILSRDNLTCWDSVSPLHLQLNLTKHLSIKSQIIFKSRLRAFQNRIFQAHFCSFIGCHWFSSETSSLEVSKQPNSFAFYNLPSKLSYFPSPSSPDSAWPDATHCSHKKSINTQFPPMFRAATCARIISKEFSVVKIFVTVMWKNIELYSFDCLAFIQQLAAKQLNRDVIASQ